MRCGRRAMVAAAIWPALDYSRVPYRLYHDAEIYAREQERIFRGPVWNFLGLDAEIPEPGRFPRDLCRRHAGHRQSRRRRARSRPSSIAAPIAARWCGASCPATPASTSASITNGATGSTAALTAIPFRRGIRGKGGLDPSFDMAAHGLRPLRVGTRQRRAVRHPGRGRRAARRLSRRADPGADAPPVRPAGPGARLQSPAHPRQLEALRREHPRQLPRQPVARVSRDLRARPLDAGRRGHDGCAPPPQHHLGRGRQRHRRVRPRGLCRRRGCATTSCRCRSRRWSPSAASATTTLNLAVTSVFPGGGLRADQQQPGGPPDPAARRRRGRGLPDDARLRGRPAGDDAAPAAPGQSRRPGRARLDGGRRGDRDRPPRLPPRPRQHHGHRAGRRRGHFRPRLPGHRRAVARLLVVLRRAARASSRPARCDEQADRAARLRSARRVRRADRRGAITTTGSACSPRNAAIRSCRARITTAACRRR